ncbi:MAG: hypothetical protein JW795_08025, partial [Chitinivibrionales bacterium]|nr:hypothetical protein [Chitinivibrionales bacterium]
MIWIIVVYVGHLFSLGEYDYKDNRPPSPNPPGLAVKNVPQFVTIGFDDNAYSGFEGSAGTGGMKWIFDYFKDKKNPAGTNNKATYDGTPCRVTFYCLSYNVSVQDGEDKPYVKQAWHQALVDGHELGNHSQSHNTTTSTTLDKWKSEMQACNNWLTKPFDPKENPEKPDNTKGVGATIHDIFGFRTPKLEYNDFTFDALKELGFWYDCSIEDGWATSQDGTNFLWPYTLDGGSPGSSKVKSHPGLWQMPVHCVIVPPNLRAQIKKKAGPSFDET